MDVARTLQTTTDAAKRWPSNLALSDAMSQAGSDCSRSSASPHEGQRTQRKAPALVFVSRAHSASQQVASLSQAPRPLLHVVRPVSVKAPQL